MDATTITQQMLAFQKQSFDNFKSLWDFTQTQTSGTVDQLLDQASWLPQEGRQSIDSWRTLMQQERERFVAYVDQSFAIYEEMIELPQAAAPAKTKKANNAK